MDACLSIRITICGLNLGLNRIGIERFEKNLGRISILACTEETTVLGSISPVCLTYIVIKSVHIIKS